MMNLSSEYSVGMIRLETAAARQENLRTGVAEGVWLVSAVEFS